MWFFFGLISLLGWSLFVFYKRFRANWKGSAAQCGGTPYQFKLKKQKNKTELLLAVDVAADFDFSLRRENRYDRFFKKLRLSVEFQQGDADFDESFYIIADDESVLQSLLHDQALRDDIKRLFEPLGTHGVTLKAIHSRNRRLWLHFNGKTDFETTGVAAIAQIAVPQLSHVAAAMTQAVQQPVATNRFALRAAIILAISSGLAANGIVQWMHMLGPLPRTLDRMQLVLNSAALAAIVIIALVGLTLFLLRRTSRAHLVLLEVVIIGTFGAVASSVALLRDLNMEFDEHQAQIASFTVVSKRTERTGKYGRRKQYWLRVDSQPRPLEMETTRSTYDAVNRGARVRLHVRSGYLGYRWIQQIEPEK